MNPLLAFGCFSAGEHAWGKTYQRWDGQEARTCRFCGKTETRVRGRRS